MSFTHGMSWVPYTQNTMAQHLPTTGLASPSGRPPNPSEAKGKIPMPERSRGGRVVRVRPRHRKSWWRFCFNEMNPNDVSTSEYLWNIRYVLGPLCLIIMLMWRRYGCVYCTMKYDRWMLEPFHRLHDDDWFPRFDMGWNWWLTCYTTYIKFRMCIMHDLCLIMIDNYAPPD